MLSVSAPGLLGNDVDGDGDPLTAVLETGPSNGTLALDADGSFTYTPNADFSGGDAFACRAHDRAARSEPVLVRLEVEPRFEFTGFAAPIDNSAVNVAKAGQTVPVKWRLTDDGLSLSDPATFDALTSRSGGGLCAGLPLDAIESYAGESGLQYLGAGDWQFNWTTPKSYAGQCRVMTLELADGSTHAAAFRFK